MNRYLVKEGQKVDLDEFDPDDTSLLKQGKKAARKSSPGSWSNWRRLRSCCLPATSTSCWWCSRGWTPQGKTGPSATSCGASIPRAPGWSRFESRPRRSWSTTFSGGCTPRCRPGARPSSSTAATTRTCWWSGCTTSFPQSEWKKRYDQIVAFERMLYENGTTILKFFLHIGPDEQRKRLQARLDDPEEVLEVPARRPGRTEVLEGLHAGLPGRSQQDVNRVGSLVHRSGQQEVVPQSSDWNCPGPSAEASST